MSLAPVPEKIAVLERPLTAPMSEAGDAVERRAVAGDLDGDVLQAAELPPGVADSVAVVGIVTVPCATSGVAAPPKETWIMPG